MKGHGIFHDPTCGMCGRCTQCRCDVVASLGFLTYRLCDACLKDMLTKSDESGVCGRCGAGLMYLNWTDRACMECGLIVPIVFGEGDVWE